MPSVYFRTDGNEEIATGHIMRCLSIARACRALSMEAHFLVSDEKSASLLEERLAFLNEFPIVCLHSNYRALDGELPIVGSILKEAPQNSSWLFIDSYFVTETYLSELRKLCPVAYLDDLLAFDYPADLIVNYDTAKEPACYHKAARRLTGAAYTPLREQFQNVSYTVRPKVRNVFLSAGGTDACNVIGTLLHKIPASSFLRDLNYHVITSRLNSHFQELECLASRYPAIHIHTNVQDMAALMCQCDLGISAGGTTLYELCAVGVPSSGFMTADNQSEAIRTFSDNQIIPYAGDARSSPEKTCGALLSFLGSHRDSYAERQKSSRRMRAFIDGRGAYRIASALKDFFLFRQ
ncbi:MAG: UDP-2,4-diacetamido-2,4,6-trideoxy-beta-L-altropyranose hydrolase [Blautia sp.]|nr:UDP-2,4-diacetamido-2,4,6-trideoxy-beta-L-altropyranose hydrolase [Blautia sp.]MCM1200865.1 UDP-2,4-diacetamido-2,4,6-trideoxy-beta-L-altropyranose hydrolase [Bacteroides fragilis]